LVKSLGADLVVRRGDDVADRVRTAMPEGVDAVADGAALAAKVVPAIRDGGGLAVTNGCAGPAECGITVHQTIVTDYPFNQTALDRLRAQAQAGTLTLRVAGTFPAAQAAAAHRQIETGGTRGRLVLEF
jgi:NADPH:quinone reductase